MKNESLRKGGKTSNPLQQRAERGNREMKGNKIASGRETTLRYSCVAPLRCWILIGWVAAVMMGFRWYLPLRHVSSPPPHPSHTYLLQVNWMAYPSVNVQSSSELKRVM